MQFTTTYGTDYLTLNPDIVFGTAMLGRQFGVIKSASLKRTGQREEFLNDAGELRLVLIKNPGFELMLSCAFDRLVSPPGIGEKMTLPLIGVSGYVMEGVTVLWESGDERLLNIPVSSWDSLVDPVVYRIDPINRQRLNISIAGQAPLQAPSLTLLSAAATAATLGVGLVNAAQLYQIDISSDGGQTWTRATTTTEPFATVSPLSPGTSYRARARAQSGEATGPWSASLLFTTAAASAAPATAPVLRQLDKAGGVSEIYWAAVPGAEAYQVETRRNDGAVWESVTSTASRSIEWFGRIINDIRSFRVRGRNSAGDGPWGVIHTRFRVPPVLVVRPVNRTTDTWLITVVSGKTSIPGYMEIRWHYVPDMREALLLDQRYNAIDFSSGYPVQIDSAPQPGTTIYWQAREVLPGGEAATDWGPVVSSLSSPPIPVNIVYNPDSVPGSYARLRWANPGGALDGWRLYRKRGNGPLQGMWISGQLTMTLHVGTTSLDSLVTANDVTPAPGDLIYVVSVRNDVESPLPNPVVA